MKNIKNIENYTQVKDFDGDTLIIETYEGVIERRSPECYLIINTPKLAVKPEVALKPKVAKQIQTTVETIKYLPKAEQQVAMEKLILCFC